MPNLKLIASIDHFKIHLGFLTAFIPFGKHDKAIGRFIEVREIR